MAFGGAGPWTQRLLPWLGVALLIVTADQFTKIVVENALRLGDVRPVTGYFSLVLAHNRGAAFSMFDGGAGWQARTLTGVGIGASVFILYLLARHGSQRLFSCALALILGGALGNVLDRLLHGHVIDFLLFHYRQWEFPAFNVADSAITAGAALLILDELLRVRRSG
jgi:signal peptidase II